MRVGGWMATLGLLAVVVGGGSQPTAASSTTFQVTTPSPFQVIQRSADGTASIRIEGEVGETRCDSIEASFNGGEMTTIDGDVSDGRFSGALASQPAGQGPLRVRCGDHDETVDDVGVGEVFVVAGQSNAAGVGATANVSTSSKFRSTQWVPGLGWQPGDDESAFAGSVWPIVATSLMDDQEVPFGHIETAVGGTCLVCLPDVWSPVGDRTAYESMVDAVTRAAPDGVRAVLWFQGESDAIAGISGESYAAALRTLAESVSTDLPGAPPVVAGAIGQLGETGTEFDETDAIRLAIQESWDDGTTLPGPVMHDVGPLQGSVFRFIHFVDDDEIQTFARRWWAVIDAHFFGGEGNGRGPRLRTATLTESRTEIHLEFETSSSVRSSEANIGGILVEADGVAVGSASRIVGETSVLITLDEIATGRVTVSIGSANSAGQDDFLTDSSEAALPAETRIDVVASPEKQEVSVLVVAVVAFLGLVVLVGAAAILARRVRRGTGSPIE